MRVAVLVLLHLERLAALLEQDGDFNVEGFGVFWGVRVEFRLDVSAGKRPHPEPSLQVHKWHTVAVPIVNQHGRDASILGHPGVVRPKCGGGVHDARAVFCGDEVAGDDLERRLRLVHRLGPIQQRVVAQAHQVGALDDRQHLVVWVLLPAKLLAQEGFGQHHQALLFGVSVRRFHHGVRDGRSDRQGGVGRKRPRGRRPRQKVKVQALVFQAALGQQLGLRSLGRPELGDDCRVLDVAVGARLVQFMGTQPRPRHGAVGLDGVAFVEQPFPVHLGQQPPNRLHVLGVVGHVRRLHVHPVAHLTGQLVPLRGVPHHRLAAGVVVLLHRQLGANVLFGDAELLLHTKLHGESMRVPPCLPLHAVAFQGLKAAENVLDGPGHHVVDAGLAVGAGGTLKEHVRLVGRTRRHALLKGLFVVPNGQPLLAEYRQIQRATFRKFQRHRGSVGRFSNAPPTTRRGLRPRR